jgi:hypothetical protein
MNALSQFANETLKVGLAASAATTLACNALGELEEGNAIAPINAVSHILWGDRAARQENASVKYTLTGGLLNTAAVVGWAGVHRLLFGRGAMRPSVGVAIAQGCATSALAYVTDYYVVPKRFTPGFEKRLSSWSLMAVYGTLALALAAGSFCSRK